MGNHLRPNFRLGNALVPVAQTLRLGRHTVCTWLFTITLHLRVVNASVAMQVVARLGRRLTFREWHKSHAGTPP